MSTSALHPFEASGLGHAPFKCVGVAELPSPSLAASNPAGYNNALAMVPRGYGCGSCAHCGMPLKYNFLIHSADGKRFAVGSECVFKTGDKRIGSEVKRLEADRRREATKAKRLARQAIAEERYRAAKAEREAAEAAAAAAREAAERPIREARKARWSFVVPAIRAQHPTPFIVAMFDAIERGDEIKGRAYHILGDIYAKHVGGRGGSKAYKAALEDFHNRTGG